MGQNKRDWILNIVNAILSGLAALGLNKLGGN